MRIVVKTIDRARDVAAELARQFLAHQDRGLLVTIEPYAPPKTGKQNAKIHAMVGDLANRLGHDAKELTEYVIEEYCPTKTVTVGDRAATVPKRISELSRAEASVLIERIYQIAAECGQHLE